MTESQRKLRKWKDLHDKSICIFLRHWHNIVLQMIVFYSCCWCWYYFVLLCAMEWFSFHAYLGLSNVFHSVWFELCIVNTCMSKIIFITNQYGAMLSVSSTNYLVMLGSEHIYFIYWTWECVYIDLYILKELFIFTSVEIFM